MTPWRFAICAFWNLSRPIWSLSLTAPLVVPREFEYAQIAFLSLAGASTTKGLLESALYVLANDLTLQQTLHSAPSLIPAFLNEVLRTRPPLRRIIGRRTTREIELRDSVLPRSALLMIDLELAQRDELVFPDPTGLICTVVDRQRWHLASARTHVSVLVWRA